MNHKIFPTYWGPLGNKVSKISPMRKRQLSHPQVLRVWMGQMEEAWVSQSAPTPCVLGRPGWGLETPTFRLLRGQTLVGPALRQSLRAGLVEGEKGRSLVAGPLGPLAHWTWFTEGERISGFAPATWVTPVGQHTSARRSSHHHSDQPVEACSPDMMWYKWHLTSVVFLPKLISPV